MFIPPHYPRLSFEVIPINFVEGVQQRNVVEMQCFVQRLHSLKQAYIFEGLCMVPLYTQITQTQEKKRKRHGCILGSSIAREKEQIH